MSKNKFFKCLFFLLFFSTFSISTLFAQQRNNQSEQVGTNSGFNTYFVDQVTLSLGTNLTPIDDYLNPDEYLLGPNDVLSIYGNGLVEFAYRALMINPLGDLAIPTLGIVSVKGLTLKEASKKIISEFDQQLKNTTVSVTIDRPRPVTVHVGGNIPNPGRYVLPAGTRFDFLVTGISIDGQAKIPLIPFNKLTQQTNVNERTTFTGLNLNRIEGFVDDSEKNQFSAEYKNLSSQYNLRNLKVTSKNDDYLLIDLQGYLLSGDQSKNPYIRDGDRIYISNYTEHYPFVSISGAINNPIRVPYKPGDTIEDLISIGGGIRYDADSSFVYLNTSQSNSNRYSANLFEEIKLTPNSNVIIPFNNLEKTSSVWVLGEVTAPGNYFITEGSTSVDNIINQAGGLTSEALPNGAYLIRNDINQKDVPDANNFNPVLLTRTTDSFLEGFDYLDLERTLGINRVPLNLTSSQVLQSTTIADGDKIYIPKNTHSVTLMGQVNNPGLYSFQPQQDAQNYISDAGGMTLAADLDRIFIIKAGSRTWYKAGSKEIESGDIVFVDRQPLEDVSTGRNYQIQRENLKNSRVSLILGGISAIAGVITTIVAIRR
tara:strand:- start:474 stop:2267 length:1794 start_codon:yes stop_codon:yes gene_type:complete